MRVRNAQWASATSPRTTKVFTLLGKLGAIDDEANCRAVREALNAARAAGYEAGREAEPVTWQEIGAEHDGPPWDGKPVLIATNHRFGSRVHCAHWTSAVHGGDIHGWAVSDCKFGPYALRGYTSVTHWMPLPDPPEKQR